MKDSETIKKWDESKEISKEINIRIQMYAQTGIIKLTKDNDILIESEYINTIHSYLLGLKKGLSCC
tara:strand:- start:366 stop:563 length:198 start_codon:yes stop_codon:yes gene_type:complete